MASAFTSRSRATVLALFMLIGNLPIAMGPERANQTLVPGEDRIVQVSSASTQTESPGLTKSSQQQPVTSFPCFGCVLVDVSRVPLLRFLGKVESLSAEHDRRERIQLIDRILLQI